jgi:hypothetical protein
MTRVLWEFDGKLPLASCHCGNCKHSTLKRNDRTATCKGYPVVEEVDKLNVKVTSTCSGLSNVMLKSLLKT